MANLASAKKRIRQNIKHQARNKVVRTRTRTFIKRAREAMDQNDETMAEQVRLAVVNLDLAASKGVIHRNNADRRKSRLMKRLAALQIASSPKE